MRRNLTIRVWLDDRTTSKKHGGHPVKLVVTFHGRAYSRSLGYYFPTEREYNRHKRKWQALEVQAWATADAMPDFSPDAFFDKFFGAEKDALTLAYWIERKADQCKTPRNADTFRNAFKFFRQVSGKNSIYLADITADGLRRMEKKALTMPIAKGGKPYGITTWAMHCGKLRTVYRAAVAAGVITINPFDAYQIPSGRKTPDVKNHVRRSLTPHELNALWQYRPENDRERWALDLWKFSYLTGGMPLVDMAGLTTDNIRGGAIEYRRKKTENTVEDGRVVMIPIMRDAEPLLYKYQEGRYLFGIYEDKDTPKDRARKLNNAQSRLGNAFEVIRKEIDIQYFTFDSARHTASAMLQRAGITPEQVAQVAGNSAKIVRDHYSQITEEENRAILEQLPRPGESK